MGRAIDYCTVCGDRVAAQDLEKGKALEVAEKVYCGKCRDQAPAPVAVPANGRKRTGSTGTFPSVRPVGTGTGRLPNVGSGSQRMPQAGPTTQRLAQIQLDEAPEAGKSKAPLIAGGVAAVVLVGAAILFFVQSSQEAAERAAKQKYQDDAKAAYQQVVDFRQQHQDDADGLIKLIDESAKKTKGTEWAGKLGIERDDAVKLKAAQEINKERQGRLDALRTAVNTSKDLPSVIANIEKFQHEMEAAQDTDRAKQAIGLIRTAKERGILAKIDEAKNYEVQNPEEYDKLQAMWADVLTMCEAGFENYAKTCADKISAVKQRREDAAQKEWTALKAQIENLRKQKKWDDCQKLIRDFTAKWKGAAMVDEATRLAWDIDGESKKVEPGVPVKPDPGKVPPKDWTTLYDEKNAGGWRSGGAKMTWAAAGGEMVGTNTISADDANKDTQFKGVGFWFTEKAYAGYEMEVELKLVKGEAMFLMGINGVDPNGAGIPLRTASKGDGNAESIVAADKVVTVTIQVRADSISLNGAGVTGGNWKINRATDGKDHGAGQIGFALYPGSELHVRKARIRAIP